MHRAVLRPAEGEHVAAPVALRELGDPVAPFEGTLVVEHGRAGGDQEAAGPGARDRDLCLAFERGRRRLVQIPHAFVDLRNGDERGSLEREPEHLEIGDAEPAPELGGERAVLAGSRQIAALVREVAVMEGEPAVLGPGLERIEQPVSAREPTLRNSDGAVEVELVDREPGRHASGARRVLFRLVEAVGALAGRQHRRGVVEPPRGPAQPLEGLGRLLTREGLLEGSSAPRPSELREARPSPVEPGRRHPASMPLPPTPILALRSESGRWASKSSAGGL